MHAFTRLAYMDVQKTGSTFVSQFLDTYLDDECISFVKHGRMDDEPPPERLNIISVREPLDAYVSLFSFGCEKRGVLYRKLSQAGYEDLYVRSPGAFAAWLSFVLDPDNAEALVPASYYNTGVAPFLGLFSFRVAVLSMPKPMRKLKRARNRKHCFSMIDKGSAIDEVLHAETLNADLERLIRKYPDRLSWKPSQEAALGYLRGGDRVNDSSRIPSEERASLPQELKELVVERDEYVFSRYGYDPAEALA